MSTGRIKYRSFLCIDWDFFFPNPLQGAEFASGMLLYDWSHVETMFHINGPLWIHRAVGFMQYDIPLPRAQGYQGFWDRFNLRNSPTLYYGDSNMHAGLIFPEQADWWNLVSLWDNHHDSGYRGTYDEWLKQDKISCEDWMLAHYAAGSKLEVNYPPWRTAVKGIEAGPLVPVHRRIDNGHTPQRTYEKVYLCRSGAWVPPWCDDQFTELLGAFPGPVQEVEGNEWTHPRPDVVKEAEIEAQTFKLLRSSGRIPLASASETAVPTAVPTTG